MTKDNKPAEALSPQPDLIPEKAMDDLQRLAAIKGYSLQQVIAGWWIRFGEVQTLQIELDYKDTQLKDLHQQLSSLKNKDEEIKELYEEISKLPKYGQHERISRIAVLAKIKLFIGQKNK